MTHLLTLLVGLFLWSAGRKLFWPFVAAMGFVVGLNLATRFVQGELEWVLLLVALGVGVVGALVAIMLQKLAVAAGGFLAGGFLATNILNAFSPDSDGGFHWFE